MNTYALTIKSHTDYPDFEQEVKAENENEAVEMFYEMLRGEFDREFIKENMEKVANNIS